MPSSRDRGDRMPVVVVGAGQLDVAAGALATESLASPGGAEVPLGFATLEQAAAASPTTVAAAYLVGADGAHSRVRARLGVAMDGPDHLWLYGRAWDRGRERLEDYTDERLAGLVRTAAGADLPVRIIAKGAFSFAAQVAERYRSGRAFLAGDAAQRMTPRGGMGMNTAGAEALAEDLRDRLPHAWLDPARTRSTLDLLGPGLTLLSGPHGHAWAHAAAATHPAFLLDVHPSNPALRPPSPSPPTARS